MQTSVWTALARVERREMLRHPQRTALLVGLVALPVAALVAGSTLAAMMEPTAEARAISELGQADLAIDGLREHDERVALDARLPAGVETARVFIGQTELVTAGRRSGAEVYALRAEDLEGLAAGMLRIVEGQAPQNSGEVAISPSLLSRLHLNLGDRVALSFGPTRTITGIVVRPEGLRDAIVLRPPAAVEYRGTERILVGLPGGSGQSKLIETLQDDYAVVTRTPGGGGTLADILFVLGTIGFFEAGLVVSAAVAVGLRRRRHQIGLLGACGATPQRIAKALLGGVLCQAVVGAILGAGFGVAVAAGLHPMLDGWSDRLCGPFRVAWLHLFGAVLLGVLASALAIWLPVRRIARLPLREALGARRPVADSPNRWLVRGVFLLLSGIALLAATPQDNTLLGGTAIVLGPILGLFGLGACSPWLLATLGRFAGQLPLVWRLAVRDAGRFRNRNGPAVTAVVAGMAMTVTVAVLLGSLGEATDLLPQPLRDDQLLIEGPDAERAARRIAASDVARGACSQLQAAYCGGQPIRVALRNPEVTLPRPYVVTGSSDLLRAFGVETGFDRFAAGHLVAINVPEEATIALSMWASWKALPCPPVTHVQVDDQKTPPTLVLHEAMLAQRGYSAAPPLRQTMDTWLVRLVDPIDDELLVKHAQPRRDEIVNYRANTLDRPDTRSVYFAALLLSGLTGLVVIAIATTLSAQEAAEDAEVLHAIGAAPGLRRRLRASYAAYLALLGCALAIPAGLLPAHSILTTANLALPFVLPWRDLFWIVIGLPIVTYIGTWLIGGRSSSLRRVTT